MRVLGIDPGSHVTGWGAVGCSANRLHHLEHGTIRGQGELASRLRCIGDELDALLLRLEPDVVAVEGIFHQKNSRSALVLGHARGVILLSISRCEIPLFEYAPAEIKRAATGHGRASKGQVQSMVGSILSFDSRGVSHDAADALAAALCHALLAPARGGARLPLPDAGPPNLRRMSPLAKALRQRGRS